MRWIGWTLCALPGLAAAAAAFGYWVERTERERLGRRVEIYPLEGARVRLEEKPDWGAAEAVVVDADGVPRPEAEAVKFSWRRDDSGPLERPEAGVLKLEHHGRPITLIYSPELRAALRVHPFGRLQTSRGKVADERGFALVAAFWFVCYGIVVGYHIWQRERLRRVLDDVLTK